MSKYSVMTPEIDDIDKAINTLKARRQKLVDREVKKKTDALCAEMRNKKAK